MFDADCFKSNEVYDFYPPKGTPKGLLSIPHSGEIVPSEFNKYLTEDQRAMMEDVDYRVNELVAIEELTDAGIAVIVAKVHRYCIDLNRAPELALLNWKQNSKGIEIVVAEPSMTAASDLINKYHAPYYEALKAAVHKLEELRGTTVPMIDLHSMPSRPTEYHMKLNPDQKMDRPDFCVSHLLENHSCSDEFINYVVKDLCDSGYDAVINDPYFGGFVTKYVNQFNTNNIQIETNRRIYMDETKKELVHDKVKSLKPILTKTVLKTLTTF